jgi:hypothetical protein
MLLDAGWLLQKILSLGGLAFALAGIATFGWYFVRLNALAAHGDSGKVPPEAWRGTGARYGYSIFAAGVAMAVASMILGGVLPGRL